MSGFITNTGENFLLNLVCRAVSAPEVLYVALIAEQQPTKFTTGDEIDEPGLFEYERAVYPNSSGAWTERSGEMANLVPVYFNELSGNEVWPTLRYWGLLDRPVGGALLWAGALDNPLVLSAGDQVVLPPESITIRMASYLSRVSLI